MIGDIIDAYVYSITKGHFDFKGMASAREYTYFLIILFLLMAVAAEISLYVAVFNGNSSAALISILAAVIVLTAHGVSLLSITNRRMRDTGKYGLNLFLFVIFLVCLMIIIKFKGLALSLPIWILSTLFFLLMIRLCFVKTALPIPHSQNEISSRNCRGGVNHHDGESVYNDSEDQALNSIIGFDSRIVRASKFNQCHLKQDCVLAQHVGHSRVTDLFAVSESYYRKIDPPSTSFSLNMADEKECCLITDVRSKAAIEDHLLEQYDAALLIVTLTNAVEQVALHSAMLKMHRLKNIAVFVNVCEVCDSPSVIDLCEMEVRSSLMDLGYGFFDVRVKVCKVKVESDSLLLCHFLSDNMSVSGLDL